MGSRQHIRLPIQCRVQYSGPGDSAREEGTVLDLSTGGWKIQGSRPVPLGTALSLHVSLPDAVEPMEVELAVVHWSQGATFGLKNTILGEEEWKRLRRYVVTHVKKSDLSLLRSV